MSHVQIIWFVFIIKFLRVFIDSKSDGDNFSEQIFSARFNVARCEMNIKVSGWMLSMLLCWRLSSNKFRCWRKRFVSIWESSLFFKFNNLRFVNVTNDSLLMFRNRLFDKSKWVKFTAYLKSSDEKLTSLLSSKWRIFNARKLIIACGWNIKILFLLKSNSSKLDWWRNIRWQMIPMLLFWSESVFICLQGRNVSQWIFSIWLFWRWSAWRFPGPTNASLSISVNLLSLKSILCKSNDLRNNLAGNEVSSFLLKLAYFSLGKYAKVSDVTSFNPALSKSSVMRFWNLWMISTGMVFTLNSMSPSRSCFTCRYRIFSSLIPFVLIMTISLPMESLHESPCFGEL